MHGWHEAQLGGAVPGGIERDQYTIWRGISVISQLAMCFPVWMCLLPAVPVAVVVAYGWLHGVRPWSRPAAVWVSRSYQTRKGR